MKILILINPEDASELNTWKKTMPNANYIVVINSFGNIVPVNGISNKDEIFDEIKIVGHGGNGTTFFYGLKQNTVKEKINEILLNKVKKNADCRFQICSFGNKLGKEWVEGIVSLKSQTANISTPNYLSAIWLTKYFDFKSGAIKVEDLKSIKSIGKYIEGGRKGNASERVKTLSNQVPFSSITELNVAQNLLDKLPLSESNTLNFKLSDN